MINNDTIQLLKECDSGSKMAVSSLDEILGEVRDSGLKQLLSESREHHKALGDELHSMLLQCGSEEKEPSAIAKGMSWMKTNMKMGMEHNAAPAADIITDGCNMGVKTLHKFLNQYDAAAESSRDICKRLISIEDTLCRELRSYL